VNDDRLLAIIANDLDSLCHRIEDLPGHPELTKALGALVAAKSHVTQARIEIHHTSLSLRFAADFNGVQGRLQPLGFGD
jgi:hypothetical protein